MENELLQEMPETVSDNQIDVLEGEETSSDLSQDQLYGSESVSSNSESVIESDNEVLDGAFDPETVSDNFHYLPENGQPPSDLYNLLSEVSEPVVPLFESDIDKLSTTDTLLFLILCFVICYFVHGIFKGSHWFRRL